MPDEDNMRREITEALREVEKQRTLAIAHALRVIARSLANTPGVSIADMGALMDQIDALEKTA